jgi:hypothetical protein
MTILEVINQLYELSVDGFFNMEHFTKDRFHRQCVALLRGTGREINGKPVIVQMIKLPDKWWYFYIIEYAPKQYDYYIPDTPEQEKRVIAILD